MDIPIRFSGQQQQQPQTSSWGSQQGYQQQQPSYHQQQPSTSSWGQQQQIPQQQTSSWGQGQQSSWQKPGMFTGVSEQGLQQQKFMQHGGLESQKYGQSQMGQVGSQVGQSQIGQIVQKEIRAEHVSSVDLSTLFVLLRLTGHCYVKEHGLCNLADDKQGLLKKWHKEVTLKNLDYLTKLSQQWGLSLPFPVKPEQREQEIKQALSGAPKIITEGELLMDLCIAAHVLEPIFTCGFMNGTNEELREFCRNACSALCDNFINVKHGLKSTDQDFCPPCVKSVVCREGVCDRK